MADTFNTDFTIQLFPKAPEQVPIRETIERVAGRMLGTERAEIDALQATVGDYTPAEFSDRTITELLQTQGFVQKLEVMATREDDIYEELNNKILNDPIINPVGITHASHVIQVTADESPVTAITLTAIQPGTAGNSLSVRLANSSASDVTVDDNDIRIRVNGVLTVSQLYNKLVATKAVTDLVTVTLSDLPFISLLSSFVEIDPTENFTGGTDGTAALTSTSEELDATVDAIQAYTPDGADLGTDMGTLWAKQQAYGDPTDPDAIPDSASATLTVNSLPTDLDTVTIAMPEGDSFSYRFRTGSNAAGVDASNTLTITGNPTEGSSVTIGTEVYRFRRDVLREQGLAATETININGLPAEGGTVTIGSDATEKVYKFRATALGAGVKATGTFVHSDGATQVTDGKVVVVNDQTYRFKTVMAQANDVQIGANALASLDNLVAAINLSGTELTEYFTGTAAAANVVAARDTNTITVTADTEGFAANAYATTTDEATLTAGAAAMAGGIDPQAANDVFVGVDVPACIANLVAAITGAGVEGTNYGTGTTAHTTATAAAGEGFVIVDAQAYGFAGNDIVITENATNLTLTGGTGTLTGGYDAAALNDVFTNGSAANAATNLINAITFNGGAGTYEGTQYWGITAANTDATAVTGGAGIVTVTANAVGYDGNSIEATEDGDTDTVLAWTTPDVLAGGYDAWVAYDVYTDVSAEAAIDNLKAAINNEGTTGTDYAAGTLVNSLVYADKLSASTVKVIADDPGTEGNSITVAQTLTDPLSIWDGTTLSGGDSFTDVVPGKIYYNSDHFYINTGTVLGEGVWKRGRLADPVILVVNDNNASVALQLTAASQTVVVVDNNSKGLILPAASGSGREIRISNKNSAGLTVTAASGETIGANDNISIAQYGSVILVDYAAGDWAQF